MKLIGFDFETHLIEPGNIAPDPVCCSIVMAKYKRVLTDLEHHAEIAKFFTIALKSREHILVAHHMPFDAMLLHVHYDIPIPLIQRAIDEGRLRDTMVREQLIAIQLGSSVKNVDIRNGRRVEYNLAACAKTYCKVDISDTKTDPDAWRLRYAELANTPLAEYPRAAYDYALMDSVYALKVFAGQCREESWTSYGYLQDPDDPTLIRDEIAQTRCAWDAHCMAALEGPHVDQEEASIFEAYHTKQVEIGQQGVIAAGLLRWNPNKYPKKGPPKSPERAGWSENQAAIREAVVADCEARGVEPLKTETGKVSIKGDVLLECTDPALRDYGEAQASRKMMSAFLDPLKQAGDHRLTSSPNCIVNTGRMSWRGPNLQQPPKKGGWRECFVPEHAGNVFCSIDYSAIEMAALAQVMAEKFGNRLMMDAINGGKDVHIVFGAKILNISYAEMLSIYQDVNRPKYSLIATARDSAKPFNFGRAGGMGAPTFLSTLDDGVKAALQTIDPEADLITITSRLLRLWDDTWDAHSFFREVGKRTRSSNSGRYTYKHPISGRVRGSVGYCDGCNLQFQGRVADGLKNSLRLLADWMYSNNNKYKTPKAWAAIHDEVLFEGPRESVTEWAQHASHLMVQGMQKFIPDVQLEAAPAAMDRWMKEADTWYENGELIPWSRRLVPVEQSIPKTKGVIVKPYYADPGLIELKGPETQLEQVV